MFPGYLVRRAGRGLRQGDEGSALVMVVGAMAILMMLAIVAITYTVQGQQQSRRDQDYAAAMSAAQSGVEDFIGRLNRNDIYFKNVDCSNVAWQGPMPAASNSCGWGPDTPAGWLPVDSAKRGDKDGWFHYSIDAAKGLVDGTVVVMVTGRANGIYRTVESAVGKGGSTDYVYYTDFESADPSNRQAYSTNPKAACGGSGYSQALYWYKGRSSASCQEIQFASGDVLDGAVFSNDTILSSGATFQKSFETADPACLDATAVRSTWTKCLRSGSSANFGERPSYGKPYYINDNSAEFAVYPGCHYYGSTRIVFNGDGTMTVWNKKANNDGNAPLGIAEPGGTTPVCGGLDDLDKAPGATVPVPNNAVIYADAPPGSSRQSQCDAGQLGGPTGKTLPLGTYSAAVVDTAPTTSSSTYTYDQTMAETNKYCQQGNLYIEGVVQGRVTIAAAQSLVLTGDLVLAGGLNGTDMVGLVATNSVEVFHPWMLTVGATQASKKCDSRGRNCTYTYKWNSSPNSGGSANTAWPAQYDDPSVSSRNQVSGIQVMASIQTLQHSFYVQQYNLGSSLGTLQVNGSIAQRWRGIVGTGSGASSTTGYLKKYVYDTRLTYSAPPYFPKWVNAQWAQKYFGESQTDSTVKK